jgi:uncharacterized membrane protein (DUF373 family)
MAGLSRIDKIVNYYGLKILHGFERLVVLTILLLMMVVVASEVYELAHLTFVSLILNPPTDGTIVTLPELHSIFGYFLLILIGIELIETVKVYLLDDSIRVEIVFLVAMIAIARHVIDLDYKSMNPLALLGIAAIMLSLTLGYFYLRKSGQYPWKVQIGIPREEEPPPPE